MCLVMVLTVFRLYGLYYPCCVGVVLLGLASLLRQSTDGAVNVLSVVIMMALKDIYPSITKLFKDEFTICAACTPSITIPQLVWNQYISYFSISSWSPAVSEQEWMMRKRFKRSELKVLNSQTCWEIGKQREQTCHSRPQQSSAPIFRAVLSDNLLGFSCADTKASVLNRHVGTVAVKEKRFIVHFSSLAFLPPAFLHLWVFA